MTRIATYARFSTDHQRDSSIDDQRRNCLKFAERQGWPEPIHHFEDRAISGALKARPGYQEMLADAERGEFDILLVDDLSRLSRDDVETKTVIRRFKFRNLRIIGVSDGYDSAAKGEKIQSSMRGLMNEMYIDDLREKVMRGMTGQAMKGNNVGGRCYGYRHVPQYDPTKTSPDGQPLVLCVRREINDDQAEVIRTIFELFAQGWSPRGIAKHLNDAGIPSPRGGKWLQSAIYGDPDVGYGILNNPLYSGRFVWNRRECRKNPDTGKRVHVRRDESEWITTEMPDLRIVSEQLWAKVKARQERQRSGLGVKVREGLTRSGQAKAQKGFRYLLSGLLKCDECGGNFVVCSSTSYGCTSNLNGGKSACANGHRLPRKRTEKYILGLVRNELLTPDACDLFATEVEAALKSRSRESQNLVKRARKDAASAQAEIDSIMNAIRAGVITNTTRQALEAAETRLEEAQASLDEALTVDETAVKGMVAALPRAIGKYRKALDRIEDTLSTRLEHSRELLRDLLGEISLRPNGHALEARMRLDWLSTLRECQAPETAKLKVMMVAEEGLEPPTRGL